MDLVVQAGGWIFIVCLCWVVINNSLLKWWVRWEWECICVFQIGPSQNTCTTRILWGKKRDMFRERKWHVDMFLCVCREKERNGVERYDKKLVGWASWVSFVWKLLSIRLNTNCWVQVEKQGRTREHRWIRHEERRKAHMTRVKRKKKKITNFKKRSLNSGTQNFIYFLLKWVGWLERERERGSVVLERTKYQSAVQIFY